MVTAVNGQLLTDVLQWVSVFLEEWLVGQRLGLDFFDFTVLLRVELASGAARHTVGTWPTPGSCSPR